jgi:hypothetical protein
VAKSCFDLSSDHSPFYSQDIWLIAFVGAFHGNIPHVTQTGIEATTR